MNGPRHQTRNPDSEWSANELADHLADLLVHLGVTRVGDLTHLDSIGVPVWFACRPNSRSLSVSQGKGVNHGAARISAVMESIEHHFAEHPQFCEIDFVGSYREACNVGKVTVPLQFVPGCDFSRFDPDRNRLWCKGASLLTGETVVAPFDLIGLDFRVDAEWDRQAFRMSTVGLGAGATYQEAVLHALQEVVENDATVMVDALGPLRPFVSPVGIDADLGEPLQGLVHRVRGAGLEPHLVLLRSSVGLPVIGALIEEPASGPDGLAGGVSMGFACRLCPREAASAALLEAIQCRLTDIAGSRDDIEPTDYTLRRPKRFPREGSNSARSVGESTLGPSRPMPTDSALEQVIKACVANGVEDLIVFRYASESVGVSVVRLIAVGLENVAHDGQIELGVHGLSELLAIGNPK